MQARHNDHPFAIPMDRIGSSSAILSLPKAGRLVITVKKTRLLTSVRIMSDSEFGAALRLLHNETGRNDNSDMSRDRVHTHVCMHAYTHACTCTCAHAPSMCVCMHGHTAGGDGQGNTVDGDPVNARRRL